MKRLALILTMLAVPAFGVQPDEVLDDPALEARAREISVELRCPVCRNENIDDSNAGVSRDLRLMVRERLLEGDSNAEVIEAVVARYGEYVLLKPDASGFNLVLWLAAPGLLLIAGGVAFVTIRRRAGSSETTLSDEEEARLRELLDR